jgi:antitoxin (DNA-binding transcriptional repressor) of toxin-antitoxin stability system
VKTIEISTASKTLAEYTSRLRGQVVVLTRRRRPVAALVSLRNVDRETLTLSGHPEFLALIRRARREFATGRKLSLAEMKRAVLPPRRKVKRRGHRG